MPDIAVNIGSTLDAHRCGRVSWSGRRSSTFSWTTWLSRTCPLAQRHVHMAMSEQCLEAVWQLLRSARHRTTYLLIRTALCLQFTKAVESKQVAQQDAERARFVVMRADQVPCRAVQCYPLATPMHTPPAYAVVCHTPGQANYQCRSWLASHPPQSVDWALHVHKCRSGRLPSSGQRASQSRRGSSQRPQRPPGPV